MPTTTEKWPLTGDEKELDIAINNLRWDDCGFAVDIIEELRARLAEAQTELKRHEEHEARLRELEEWLEAADVEEVFSDAGRRLQEALEGGDDE